MAEVNIAAIRDAVQQLEAISFLLHNLVDIERRAEKAGGLRIVGGGIAVNLDGIARNLLDALPPVTTRPG